jgi:hypothetical protein
MNESRVGGACGPACGPPAPVRCSARKLASLGQHLADLAQSLDVGLWSAPDSGGAD